MITIGSHSVVSSADSRSTRKTMRDPIRKDVLPLEAALEKLKRIDPRQSTIVEMLYFAGMRTAEVAWALGLPERTVIRDWRYAKTWLRNEMEAGRAT